MAKAKSNSAKTTKSVNNVPQSVSNDDLEYHVKMLERIRWAQEAQKNIDGIQVAWQLWSTHLAEKYQLSTKDDISENGNIIRSF